MQDSAIMTILILAWIAVVVVAVILVTRLWKSPEARAPLPMGLAIVMAAWVIATGAQSYSTSIEEQSWTAATITIPLVAGKAIIYALLAYALGRNFLKSRSSQSPAMQRWAMPAILAVVCATFLFSDVSRLHEAALERHASDTSLSPEAVAALVSRIQSGQAKRSEAGAFLGNPLCPPDLLSRIPRMNI